MSTFTCYSGELRIKPENLDKVRSLLKESKLEDFIQIEKTIEDGPILSIHCECHGWKIDDFILQIAHLLQGVGIIRCESGGNEGYELRFRSGVVFIQFLILRTGGPLRIYEGEGKTSGLEDVIIRAKMGSINWISKRDSSD